MLHYLYTLLIGPLRLKFMLPVRCCQCLVSVRRGEGVEHSHIEKSLLKSTTPDSVGWHIQLAPFRLLAEATLRWSDVIGCSSVSTHVITYFFEQGGCDVSDLIVSEWWKATFCTGESVLYIDSVTTFTFGGRMGWYPAIDFTGNISIYQTIKILIVHVCL